MLSHSKLILIFKNKFKYFNIILIVSVLFLNGCTSLAILGAGAAGVLTGGYIMGKDKTLKQSANDTFIDAKIRNELSKKYPNVFDNISIVTNNGEVLLAGSVQDETKIKEAEKIAYGIAGVKHVDNNLTYGDSTSTAQSLQDGCITSACRTKLIATKDIKSRNIKINTKNGIVYLSGVAHSEDELEDILSVVKSVKNIKKVVSYITIKEEVTKNVN